MARPNNAAAIDRYVRGLRAAKAAFQALPEATRERMLEAGETTALLIVGGARARILRSPSIVTRSLLNSIAYRVTKSNGRVRVGVTSGSTVVQTAANFAKGVIQGKAVRVKGIIVPGAGGSALTSRGAKVIRPSRYAHLVEFGASHIPSEPFMIPAAEEQNGPHLDRVRRAGSQIERDVARAGGRLV